MLKSVHTYCANGFEVYIICIYQCLSRLFIAFFLSAVPYLYGDFMRHKVICVGHGNGKILIIKGEALFGYASYKLDYPAVDGGRLGILVRLKREKLEKVLDISRTQYPVGIVPESNEILYRLVLLVPSRPLFPQVYPP